MLKTLSGARILDSQMIEWVGHGLLWNRTNIPAFAWRNWGRLRKFLVRTVDVPAKIRSWHPPSTCHEDAWANILKCLGENLKLRSFSLCNFLQPALTSPLLHPDIELNGSRHSLNFIFSWFLHEYEIDLVLSFPHFQRIYRIFYIMILCCILLTRLCKYAPSFLYVHF